MKSQRRIKTAKASSTVLNLHKKIFLKSAEMYQEKFPHVNSKADIINMSGEAFSSVISLLHQRISEAVDE